MFAFSSNRTHAARGGRHSLKKPSRTPARMEPLERRELMSTVIPGTTPVPLSGTSAAALPDLSGSVVFDRTTPIVVNTAGGGLIVKGSLHEQVIREASRGTLDFYQSIHCDATS